MLKPGVSEQLYAFLDNYSESTKDALGKAFLSAALTMRDDARDRLKNNPYGYHMTNLASAIIVGRVETNEGHFTATLHAFGRKNKSKAKDANGHYIDKTFMTRWFVGGTKERFSQVRQKTKYKSPTDGHFYNRKANSRSYVGAIKALDVIKQALNRAVLMNKLQDAVNSKE